jgi:transmembrane sensor
MNLNSQDIDENLLLQYLLGNTDETSRASVEAWLDADSGNREYLDRLESLWAEAGKISPAPVAVDVDAAWLRMSERISRHEKLQHRAEPEPGTIRMSPLRYALGAAAVILLLIGLYGIYKWTAASPGQLEFVSTGSVIHDTLPDGSRISLNGNSKLTCPAAFNGRFRETELSGEAFFEVKHDPEHPFIVHAGPSGIRVLGTSFLVKSTSEGVEVSVSEGRVMFYQVDARTSDTVSIVLEAGDHAKWNSGSLKPDTGDIAPDGHFWANRTLVFRRTSLSGVFALIEKYYQVKITVSDPSILDCRLTASFANEPADRVLAVIAESFGLSLETRGQNYHFTGHGCNRENN